MDGSGLRRSRLSLRQSQTEMAEALNARLGRSYDKPRVSRWENRHEPVPDEVAAAVEGLAALRPGTARTVVLANQKGGVGKTTSALNIACGLARIGRRVLLVDMDPQATATVAVLADAAVAAHRDGRTMAQVILHGRPLGDAVLHAADAPPGRPMPFDLAASHIDLAETDGRREPGFDAALREAPDSLRGDYDWIVVDAPPNLGMLTWMALAAADECIVPVRTEPYDAMGVGLILGQHSRDSDLDVNVIKEKKLTNIRSSGADEAIRITPPHKHSLEEALEYIKIDELVEVTPDDVQRVGAEFGPVVAPDQVFVLRSAGARHLVIASSCRVSENLDDIFDSPLI